MFIVDDEDCISAPLNEPRGSGFGFRYNEISSEDLSMITTIFEGRFKDPRLLTATQNDLRRTVICEYASDWRVIIRRSEQYIYAYWWPPATNGIAYKLVTRIF